MTYSLINITKENADGSVEGYWIQDVIGSWDKAVGVAYQTYLANSKKISIAITEGVNSTNPSYHLFHNLKKKALIK